MNVSDMVEMQRASEHLNYDPTHTFMILNRIIPEKIERVCFLARKLKRQTTVSSGMQMDFTVSGLG
jgi:hypothetical protein